MIHPTENRAESDGHKKPLTQVIRGNYTMAGPNHFISDLHIGDNNIIQYYHRPFKDVFEERKVIFDNIVKDVERYYEDDPEDPYFLCIAGDIGDPSFILQLFDKLKDDIYITIVKGNHDENYFKNESILMNGMCSSVASNSHLELSRYPIFHDGVWVSHEPFEYMPKECPYLNIHGHTHIYDYGPKDALKWKDGNRYFNVSCEKIGYKPISRSEIVRLLGIEENILYVPQFKEITSIEEGIEELKKCADEILYCNMMKIGTVDGTYLSKGFLFDEDLQ